MSRVILTAAMMIVGLMLASNTYAQNRSTSAPTPPTVSEQDLLDMKALAEQGARLKAETEAALKAFDEKQKELEGITNDAQGARQYVDGMIGLLRAAATRLGPNGSYVKTLKDQEDFVRNLATEALASQNTGDHVYGEQLAGQAAAIGDLRHEASDLAAKLAAEIDRLERSKTQIAYAYAVKRTDEFIKVARSYLDSARILLRGASDLATKAEKIVAPTVPTQ
jgi:hypothetical protein